MGEFNQDQFNQQTPNGDSNAPVILWDAIPLCEDLDLTRVESKMPDAAKLVPRSAGMTAYDGKRGLAKEIIARDLIKRGIKTECLLSPGQLSRAAAFLELSLIYRDLSDLAGSSNEQKAKFYYQEYKEELASADLLYDITLVQPVVTVHTISSIPCNRM